jgi:AAHS family 4-hydroxybenzoate transporter-like MFS transporter
MIPFVIKRWALSRAEAGTLMSAGLVGFTIGSFFIGQIADKTGRKRALLLSLLFSTCLNTIIPIIGDNYDSFIAIRIIAGLGQGALLPLCATLINEVAPRKYSNTLAGLVIAGMGAGGLIAAFVGIEARHYGWHIIYYACGFGLIPLLFGLIGLIESPRYLCLRNDSQRLKAVLSRLSLDKTTVENTRFYLPEHNTETGSLRALFLPRYRRNTFTITTASFCCLFGIFGIGAWIPEVISREYHNITLGLLMGGLVQLASILGVLICGVLADKRILLTLVLTWLLGALALLILGFSRNLNLSIVACAVAGFGVIGAQPLLNNLTAKLYETEVRATAVGFELGVGRIGAVLGPFIGGVIQQLLPGLLDLFFVLSLIMLVGSLIIMFVKLEYVDDVVFVANNKKQNNASSTLEMEKG